MPDHFQTMLAQLANLERKMGNMIRPGTVKEAEGGRIRPVLGKDNDGKEVLGPWLHTSNQRGGARDGRFYEKGQNLMMFSPNGDPAQAMLLPSAMNNDYKRPDHASKSGQDEETYQQGSMRTKKVDGGMAYWLQDPQQQQQGQQKQGAADSGGGDKPTAAQEHKQQKPDGDVSMKMTKNGGFQAWVKGGGRVVVHKDYVKMKWGKTQWAIVTKDKLIVSKEWVVGPDPFPDDDDSDVSGKKASSGSGSSGGSSGGGSIGGSS